MSTVSGQLISLIIEDRDDFKTKELIDSNLQVPLRGDPGVREGEQGTSVLEPRFSVTGVRER